MFFGICRKIIKPVMYLTSGLFCFAFRLVFLLAISVPKSYQTLYFFKFFYYFIVFNIYFYYFDFLFAIF